MTALLNHPWRPDNLPVRLALLFAAVGGLSGCLHNAPRTTTGGWDPECAPTPAGEACLAIRFSSESDARSSGKLTGTYHWALYHDGNVHGWGPDGDPAYAGLQTGVDLTLPGSSMTTYAAGIPGGNYQILAYLDYNLDDVCNTGEPITPPTKGFSVPGDAMTTVESVMTMVRPSYADRATSTPEEQ